MLSRKADAALTDREPQFEDIMNSLLAVGKIPRGVIKEIKKAIALARDFNDSVVGPGSLELDRRMQEDPTYLPRDFVLEANRRGFYSMWIPKIYGGRGWSLATLSPFMEELSSVCSCMGFLIGVQYFGMSILFASFNARLIDRILREVVEGEKSGNPCLLVGAVTEPEAGTDVEEVELLCRARVRCHAKKVNGGYVVNGRKVFISNGHMATWTMLIAYEDLDNPDETMVLLAVRTGTEGFSFGRMENKMGQKACPTSELIFEDCFIPDENVCLSTEQLNYLRRGPREAGMQLIDFVVASTRPGVGAAATGVARGAYEGALEFARRTEVDGKLLINHEWAQCMLAEMYKNVGLARLTYMECGYVNMCSGIIKFLTLKPLYYSNKVVPEWLFEKFMPRYSEMESTTRMLRKFLMDGQKESEALRTSGWASLSKFAATDLGIRNCQLAIELMGQAGLRHDRRVEMHLRDIKVMQIFEGTNQLNRINLFKCMIARSIPEARVFDE